MHGFCNKKHPYNNKTPYISPPNKKKIKFDQKWIESGNPKEADFVVP